MEGEAEEESILQWKDNQKKNEFCSARRSIGRINFVVQGEA